MLKKMFVFIISAIMFVSGIPLSAGAEETKHLVEGKTSIGLAEYAVKAYESRWGYVYGTFGQVLTESLLQQKVAFYPDFFYEIKGNNMSGLELSRKWMGMRVTDCIGLVKSYLWTDSFGQDPVHYNAVQDRNANQAYEMAPIQGSIENIPNIHGLLLYAPNHVGIYIGNGEVIEAASTARGVVKTKLENRNFVQWYKCPWITYPEDGEYTIAGTKFFYQDGEYVTGWYNGVYYGNDGIQTNAPAGTELVIDRESITLRVGKSKKLKATSKTGETAAWETSDSNVAVVENDGTVKAVAPGEAYVYARIAGHTTACKVIVEEMYKIYSAVPDSFSLYPHMTVNVRIETDAYADTILLKQANKDVECISSMYFADDGKKVWDLTFVPEVKGTVNYIVIAGSNENSVWSKSAEFTLHIGEPLKSSGLQYSIPEKAYSGVNIPFTLAVNGGAGTIQYQWEIYRNNVLYDTVSENASQVLDFVPEEPGVYRIKASAADGVGTVITAYSQRFAVSDMAMEISRNSVTLNVGQQFMLTGNHPAVEGSPVWKSSNASRAAVADGTITAKKRGLATITLSSTDKRVASAECQVNVIDEDISPVSSLIDKIRLLPEDLSQIEKEKLQSVLDSFAGLNENQRALVLNENKEKLVAAEKELYVRAQAQPESNKRVRFMDGYAVVSPGTRVTALANGLKAEKGTYRVTDTYGINIADGYAENSMQLVLFAESAVTGENIAVRTFTILIRGDVNRDGKVDIADYYYIHKYVNGRIKLTEEELLTADVTAVQDISYTAPVVDNEDLDMLHAYFLGKTDIEF